MIYHISLQTAGLAAGLLLILTHIWAVAWPGAIAAVRDFPRSRVAGTVLLIVAAVWSFLLVRSIDLGEFSRLRGIMLIGIVGGSILTWRFVEEFLAARALGMLLLLAADPLLESAMLRHEESRLLLVVLAYVWVVAGLFLVGMPYLLRDAIAFVTSRAAIWKMSAFAGLLYGIALIGVALIAW
jgi:hypothetical protein